MASVLFDLASVLLARLSGPLVRAAGDGPLVAPPQARPPQVDPEHAQLRLQDLRRTHLLPS